jgi:hypothetical protein
LSGLNSRGVFVPVVALFDGRSDRSATKKQLPGSLTKALGNVKTMISFGSASALALGNNNNEGEIKIECRDLCLIQTVFGWKFDSCISAMFDMFYVANYFVWFFQN